MMANSAQPEEHSLAELQGGSFELICRNEFNIDPELQKEEFDIQTYLDGKDDGDAIQGAFYRGKPVVTIPIKKLVHVTHSQDARDIINESDEYTFIPQRKCGKRYKPGSCIPRGDGSGIHDRVLSTNCVFCGKDSCSCKISWWGIDITEWYNEQGEGQAFGEAVTTLTSQKVYVSDFLQNPPESCYGTNGFSISFTKLIKQYEQSRGNLTREDKVCFKIGGTLQYSQEIAYVVFVCMKSDDTLNEYLPISSMNEKFSHQGLNEDGEIADERIPTFNITYFVKTSYRPKRQYCWENLVFALYFPTDGGTLKCNATDISRNNVPHPAKYCHRTLGSEDTSVCPDETELASCMCTVHNPCVKVKKMFCPTNPVSITTTNEHTQ